MSLISPIYLDTLFAERDHKGQAWLSSLICGTPSFDQQQVTCGLPAEPFLFVEDLLWFSQAMGSGAWTYFEATPPSRQQALLQRLVADAPTGWADWYAFGTEHWRDVEQMKSLDNWMAGQEHENTQFLWDYASRHRRLIEQVLT